jgi:NADH-quinone oxidoreductase subunit M
MNAEMAWLVIALGVPLLTALILVLLRGRGVRAAGWLAGLAAAMSLIGAFGLLPALQRGDVAELALDWVPAAGIRLELRADWLAFPFLLTEACVTLVAIVYAWGYHHLDERSPFFYALLLLFAVGMAGTTLAGSLFLFYVFWELMLIASCALIAVWGEGSQRRAVAIKYFIFTHVGSLMVLVGLLVLYDASGSDSFLALQDTGSVLSPGLVTIVTALFIIGFCVKMAIFPMHLWLPDAHAVAPMPVTIMLAAAMLGMGTYGILRFPMSIFSAEQMSSFAVPMMVAGIVSEIYGALMALAEQDVKRVIAYSSVSQMGYILFGLGTLTYQGIAGSVLHVIFHAIVKALLFMGVGLVIHATGKRRIGALGGLRTVMPLTAFCTIVGALAIAGVPPLCIFDSEWMIFAGGFSTPYMVLAILSVFGSLLTVVYALWFLGRVFFGPRPPELVVKRPHWAMIAPTALLTGLALIEGLVPAPVFAWVSQALTTILGGNW